MQTSVFGIVTLNFCQLIQLYWCHYTRGHSLQLQKDCKSVLPANFQDNRIVNLSHPKSRICMICSEFQGTFWCRGSHLRYSYTYNCEDSIILEIKPQAYLWLHHYDDELPCLLTPTDLLGGPDKRPIGQKANGQKDTRTKGQWTKGQSLEWIWNFHTLLRAV